MSQWVKALAAKPEELSLIPGTYIVGGNQLFQVALCPQHAYCAHADAHTRTLNK